MHTIQCTDEADLLKLIFILQSQKDISRNKARLSWNINSCCGPNAAVICFEHLKDIQLKGRGHGFMFVPITLVMRCISVCSNDSNEKDEMTMCKNRAGISMTCQTKLSIWCMQGQKKQKIPDPQQQGQIKENTGLTRCSRWLLKYIWITTLIITLTQQGALLYEHYLRSIS